MLVRVSLRKHSPEEIYDYLTNHIGNISLKVKYGQAIITFENPKSYERVLSEFRVVKLFGHRLEFIPFDSAQEAIMANHIYEDDGEVDLAEDRENLQKFEPLNEVDKIIYDCKVELTKTIEEKFTKMIQINRQRVEKLRLELKDHEPRDREMKALGDGVRKKLKDLENKYASQVKSTFEFIEKFAVKPNTIDLQPSFKLEENFQFPEINLETVDFLCCCAFNNQIPHFGKRLCSINREEFAVSLTHQREKLTNSFIKIFNVNDTHPKESFKVQDGCSALAMFDTLLISGNELGFFNYISLSEEDNRHSESSGNLVRQHDRAPTQVIEVKKINKDQGPTAFVTLCKDNVIRKYEISPQEVMPGVYSMLFEEKFSYDCEVRCRALQVITPTIIAYGMPGKIGKYELQKNRQRDFNIPARNVTRIRKVNQNLLALATDNCVQLLDLRSDTVVQKFTDINKPIYAVESLQEHSLFYGSDSEVGLVDDRRSQFISWSNKKYHKGAVMDVLKLANRVISCDLAGNIFSWKLATSQ